MLWFVTLFAVSPLFVIPFVLWISPCTEYTPQLTLSEWRNGTYRSRHYAIEWVSNGFDGELYKRYSDGFYTGHWAGVNESHLRVAPLSVGDHDEQHSVLDIQLNNVRTHALLRTDVEKHWRHSTFAYFWIHDIENNRTDPLFNDTLSIACFSPTGDKVAYVFDRDIFVTTLTNDAPMRVTFDGGENVFNGVPDWVYEEEVFAGNSALWWAPSGEKLAYLRTDDSLVPDFPIQLFVQPPAAYPRLSELKYPKPGFSNPQVELWIYDLSSNTSSKVELSTKVQDPIISEVVWVGDMLVAKLMDRQSDTLEIWTARSGMSAQRTRVHSAGEGWFEINHNIVAVGSDGYIDMIDVDGYNHLALFAPAEATEPQLLTGGEWDVLDKAIAVNLKTRHVYFHGAPRSCQRALFRASLDEPGFVEQVWDVGKGVYTASFSGDASFACITYSSPEIPPQQFVLSLTQDLQKNTNWTLQLNTGLQDLFKSRKLLGEKVQLVNFYDVDVNNVTVSVREIRPSSFHVGGDYGVVFFNYGGPGSQQVLEEFSVDFQRVLAEELNVLVVTVDPRGTGGRGRLFREAVRDQLGELESADVLAVARKWASKEYVRSNALAIWGWSYGGFLTLKTLERDSELLFSCGIAVAPVTDWGLYDSIYAERYMHTPDKNPEGYARAAITDVRALAQHERFLVMHGTGDDNVHFQNTLQLLDKLDKAGIENYDVHIFPDSDHTIRLHNANVIVYDKIIEFLRAHGIHGLHN